MNPSSIMVTQQEETKVLIACANLLRNVDLYLEIWCIQLELVGRLHNLLENRILA